MGEFAFLAEALAVSLICSEHLIEDIAHFTLLGMISFGRSLRITVQARVLHRK